MQHVGATKQSSPPASQYQDNEKLYRLSYSSNSHFGSDSEQLSLILGIYIPCACHCQTRPEQKTAKISRISCFKWLSPRLHDIWSTFLAEIISGRNFGTVSSPRMELCSPSVVSRSTLPRGRDFNDVSSPHMELCSSLHGSALSPWQVLLCPPVVV